MCRVVTIEVATFSYVFYYEINLFSFLLVGA